MLDPRTAWAIALLVAPAGVATAGDMVGASVPHGHTAYVELTLEGSEPSGDLARIQASLRCVPTSELDRAIAWLGGDQDCIEPTAAAVYIAPAQAPDPSPSSSLEPTGTVYVHEEHGRTWQTREYTYGPVEDPDRYKAYVLAAEFGNPQRQEALQVRGVVNLTHLGVGPGEQGVLETTVGTPPQTPVQEPNLVHVDAAEVPTLPAGGTADPKV